MSSSVTSPQTPSPFFLVGTGRCGSTLLQSMLMSHPAVRMPPETQYFQFTDPLALGQPDPLPDDRVEPYLAALRTNTGWRILNSVPGRADDYAHAVRDGLRTARDQFLWICRRMSEPQSGAVLGEKTPQHWIELERILSIWPDAKVIHIYRDPRDVVASLMTMRWWKGRSVRRTARHWRRALLAAEDWQRRLGPDRHRTVRYEDLVADPEGVLRPLAAFLGLEFSPAMLDHRAAADQAVRPTEVHKALNHAPLDPDRQGRYRASLSPFQIRLIEATVGRDLMARHAYMPDPEVPRPPWTPLDPFLARIAETFGLPAGTRVRG